MHPDLRASLAIMEWLGEQEGCRQDDEERAGRARRAQGGPGRTLPQGAGEIGLGLPGHTGQFLSAVTTGRCFWLLGSGTTVQR